MKLELFLDMDGVLCDFVTAGFAACGDTFNPVTYPKGEWGLWKALNITEKDMWQAIDSTAGFWGKLQRYPWVGELLDLHDDIKVLSSPHYSQACYAGKLKWHLEHIGPTIELILCKSKHLLAAPGRVLIDDSDENCEEWRQAGGHAVLFPTVLNSDWRNALDPIPPVMDRWQAIKREHSPIIAGRKPL